MIEINISKEMKQACPSVVLGCIQAKVTVKKSDDNLVGELSALEKSIKKDWTLEEVASIKQIQASRETYKKLGKSPSRYRVSSEALFRRILSDKGLYFVNNIVDINNAVSLKSCHSVGSYNTQNIEGTIVLSVGGEGDEYQGIGKGMLNNENLPVLKDEMVCFGSPTSDSRRAMITEEAKEILMCIYSFDGENDINSMMKYAVSMLEKYADAKEIETQLIFT